jgi:transformation/transcription domain-associated protein
MGPIFTEGILTSALMAMGRGLTEVENELERNLCLFVRDEVVTLLQSQKRPWTVDINFRNTIANATSCIVKRAETLGCKLEREQALLNPQNLAQTPVVQTVTNLISIATNPAQLMKMSEAYNPWF